MVEEDQNCAWLRCWVGKSGGFVKASFGRQVYGEVGGRSVFVSLVGNWLEDFVGLFTLVSLDH
jgi:hypothetical protein